MESTGPDYVLRMRIDLDPSAVQPPRWPQGVTVRTFTASDSTALHSLLKHGYRQGGGDVSPFGEWLRQAPPQHAEQSNADRPHNPLQSIGAATSNAPVQAGEGK